MHFSVVWFHMDIDVLLRVISALLFILLSLLYLFIAELLYFWKLATVKLFVIYLYISYYQPIEKV
jgi:hypothetical protein